MDTLSLLRAYGEDVGGTEGTLAFVAAKWLAVDPTAASDSLLTDILAKAHFHSRNSRVPSHADAFFGTRAKGILDFFGTSNSSHVDISSRVGTTKETRARIYCDGACTANGRKGAKAGYGAILIHADGTEETVSEALGPTETQTNQRAELKGLQWAFGKAMNLPEGADIYTDSEYAMKCFKEWGAGWATRGWRKSDGKDVLHQDILKPMWETWKRFGGSRSTQIRLHHVLAHTGRMDVHSRGNARADTLATASIH